MFACYTCKAKALEIGKVIDIESDDDDELSLQLVACGSCKAEFVAVYRESRRGALDGDSWHHDAWVVPPAAVRELERAIDACPSPRTRGCQCATHLALANDGFRPHLSKQWFTMRG